MLNPSQNVKDKSFFPALAQSYNDSTATFTVRNAIEASQTVRT